MRPSTTRREFISRSIASFAGMWAARAFGSAAEAEPPRWPFYAFDNGLKTIPTLEGKVKLLGELGYVGLEYHLDHDELPRMLGALDGQGLELNAVYTVPWLEDPVDPRLGESIRRMKGRKTRIELAIRSREVKTLSDARGDPKALEMLKRVSDLCGDLGPVASIYPHAGFWTEKVDDGVRLARKSERKNVGTNFNLVHWHWVKQSRPLEDVLREAVPHLFTVTINNGKKAGREIASLDQGDYDLPAFLGLLREVGYRGPVGLQCYSVPGPSEEHLARSIETWRKLLVELGRKG